MRILTLFSRKLSVVLILFLTLFWFSNGYSAGVQYDDIGRAACHNCFESKYVSSIWEALDRTKTIEIDFWDQNFNWGTGRGGKSGDWYVRHDRWQSGNNNNCGGALSACLHMVKRWSDNHRNHDVITIYLDKKQGWSKWKDGRRPFHLDQLINTIFGLKLYRPKHLKGAFGSVRDAAINGNWKTRHQLKGKIIVVMTGGSANKHNQTQQQYLAARGINAAMFVAVDLDDQHDFDGTPEHFSHKSASNVVFYNLKEQNFKQHWIDGIRMRNYVVRMWWPDGDRGRDLCNLLVKGVGHPAFFEKLNFGNRTVVDLSKRNICWLR